MDALILDDDYGLQLALARALTRRGCTVICVDSVAGAEAFVRLSPPDILVMGERVDGRLTHPVALRAECEHPDVAVILLSNRTDDDMGELFDLMPAVRAVCGRDLDPDTIGQMMLCVTGPGRPVPVATSVAPVRLAATKPAHPAAPAPVAEPAADQPLTLDLARTGWREHDGDNDTGPDDVMHGAPDWQDQMSLPDAGAAVVEPQPPVAPVMRALRPDYGQADWREALGQVRTRHLPVDSTVVAGSGAPRAAWWEDWDAAPAAQTEAPRMAAGGRRLSLR